METMARVPSLDGLRGIAVLTVLSFHFTGKPAGGWLGVEMFFVLSGYLITTSILREIHSEPGADRVFRWADAGRFYFGRALRIFPAMFEMIALYALIKLSHPSAVKLFRENVLSTLFFYSNWSRALRWGYPDYLGHTWSLAIEEQFYILFPFVLLLFLRSRRGERALAWSLLGLIVLLGIARAARVGANPDFDRLYNGTDTRIDAIALGCLLAFMARSSKVQEMVKRLAGRRSWLRTVLISCSVALPAWMIARTDWRQAWCYYYGLDLFAMCCAFAVIYIALAPESNFARVLGWRPLAFIGKRSYGLYLFHCPLMMAMFFLYKVPLGFEMTLLCGTLTLVLAMLSWRYVEAPILRLKRRRRAIASRGYA
jgi:peptidoglycan/LPS O-acetylase OafA/YrhL